MERDSRIFVAGHRGLVGSAILRRLQAEGYRNLVTRTSQELDLRDPHATEAFFLAERPEFVFLAAARVGGIHANHTLPATFIHDNLAIQNSVLHAAYRSEVKKLLFLGSSCIYPREAPQPIPEESLLTGPLEPTNQWYAIAKIAGIKACQAFNLQHGTRFVSVMPTNLYGPGDNFDLERSHVMAALIRKFHEAKLKQRQGEESAVQLWGTGAPRREFLHIDDLADACLFVMQHYESSEILNIGCGADQSIKELAETIARIVGFEGEIVWDASRPDGVPRKLLDVTRLRELGWQPRISLEEGIQQTYAWYCETYGD